MGIGAEWARIQGAKPHLKASIERHGVVVPDNAKVNEYPAYVDEIQSGGYDTPLVIMECNDQGYVLQLDASGLTVLPDNLLGVTTSATPGPFASLELLKLNPNVQSVGTNMARFCYMLDINIDNLNACENIGASAFQNCSALTSLKELMNENMLIGLSAFNACTSLSTLKIRVYRIGPNYSGATNAFSRCTGLTHVWLSKDTGRIWAPTAADGPFARGNPEMVIYTDVPDAASKPSLWQQYWNYFDTDIEYQTVYGTSEAAFDAIVAGLGEPVAGESVQLLSEDVLMEQALNTLGVKTHEEI